MRNDKKKADDTMIAVSRGTWKSLRERSRRSGMRMKPLADKVISVGLSAMQSAGNG